MSGHITDRWTIPDPARPGKRVHGPRWGKGQRWAVRWNEGGRERQQAAPTKDAAEDVLRRVQASLATGETPTVGRPAARPDVPTVADYVRQWLATTGRTEGSRRSQQGIADRFLIPRWGDVPVTDVRPTDLRAWVAELERTEGLIVVRSGSGSRVRSNGRPLSLSRRRTIAYALRSVLDIAVADEVLAANPCASVKMPPSPTKRGRSLEVDELARLLAALGDVSAQADVMGYLLCLCMLRTGEAVGLDVVEYVGAAGARMLRVDDQVTVVSGRRYRQPTKGKRRRTVPVPRLVERKLDAYLDGRGSGPLILPARGGDRYSSATWRAGWLRALEAAGIDGRVRPHDLRHTGASLLLQEGEDVKVVQAILGHAKASTTLDIYGHLIDPAARLTSAAASMDRAMSGTGGRRLRAV